MLIPAQFVASRIRVDGVFDVTELKEFSEDVAHSAVLYLDPPTGFERPHFYSASLVLLFDVFDHVFFFVFSLCVTFTATAKRKTAVLVVSAITDATFTASIASLLASFVVLDVISLVSPSYLGISSLSG